MTGSLRLHIEAGIDLIISTFLSLPSGPRFRQLKLTWGCDKEISLTAALVKKCHHTLESLSISLSGRTSVQHSSPHQRLYLPLQTARRPGRSTSQKRQNSMLPGPCDFDLHPDWIVTTLQTITNSHRNFRHISLNVGGCHFSRTGHRGWSEVDRSLFRLWESHSIQLEVPCNDFTPEDTVRK